MGRESIFEGESNNTLNLRRLMNPELDRAQARSLAYEINHDFTVRYRLGKIQERMCLTHRDKEFYQDLSFAIRAYLFSKKLERYEE